MIDVEYGYHLRAIFVSSARTVVWLPARLLSICGYRWERNNNIARVLAFRTDVIRYPYDLMTTSSECSENTPDLDVYGSPQASDILILQYATCVWKVTVVCILALVYNRASSCTLIYSTKQVSA